MAPVGSYESLRSAINAGADAVYFGVEGLNMRSRSSVNFTLDDLRRISEICDENGVKSYLTVNTIIYDEDMEKMRSIIDAVAGSGISAIIASDMAAILYARSKGVEVHISTQLSVSNTETLRYYAQFADVVVLARELNLDQVRAIHEAIIRDDIRGPRGELVRIEMFCHGALCIGCLRKMLPESASDELLGQSGSLHPDLPTGLHCHRPRDRRPARHREQIHNVAQRPPHDSFPEQDGRRGGEGLQNRRTRPRAGVC